VLRISDGRIVESADVDEAMPAPDAGMALDRFIVGSGDGARG
jgi:hypothetical protein